jgi:dTDP-4-dehydrorhamnose 3,5-epimerase
VLSDLAEFQYKCDTPYAPQAEAGILWNDPDLKIDWPIAAPLISVKDRQNPRLQDLPEECFF